jgi:hypothetical protein
MEKSSIFNFEEKCDRMVEVNKYTHHATTKPNKKCKEL